MYYARTHAKKRSTFVKRSDVQRWGVRRGSWNKKCEVLETGRRGVAVVFFVVVVFPFRGAVELLMTVSRFVHNRISCKLAASVSRNRDIEAKTVLKTALNSLPSPSFH